MNSCHSEIRFHSWICVEIIFMSKLTDYFKETKAEMAHVTWPTRRQATVFTVFVIVFSVGVAFYLGVFDYLFSLAAQHFIK